MKQLMVNIASTDNGWMVSTVSPGQPNKIYSYEGNSVDTQDKILGLLMALLSDASEDTAKNDVGIGKLTAVGYGTVTPKE